MVVDYIASEMADVGGLEFSRGGPWQWITLLQRWPMVVDYIAPEVAHGSELHCPRGGPW